jgi:hypothetical protein
MKGQGKVVPVLNSALCYEHVLASGGIAPPFLILVLNGGDWSASLLRHFTPGERAPGSHCIRRWAGPTVGLDAILQGYMYRLPSQLDFAVN